MKGQIYWDSLAVQDVEGEVDSSSDEGEEEQEEEKNDEEEMNELLKSDSEMAGVPQTFGDQPSSPGDVQVQPLSTVIQMASSTTEILRVSSAVHDGEEDDMASLGEQEEAKGGSEGKKEGSGSEKDKEEAKGSEEEKEAAKEAEGEEEKEDEGEV